MKVSVEAGNAGAAEWLDDSGRPRRTGTFWAASVRIITAVIVSGSGVLSLAWATAQLGWVAGAAATAAMLLFAFVTYYTATLLGECYTVDTDIGGKRNYTYMDAVRSNLGGAMVAFCGVLQYYANLVGVAIGYTIASSISMQAVRRAGCFHTHGHADPCYTSSISYMVVFGAVQIVFSEIPGFHQISPLSIVAAIMSFTYSSIGLSLGIAQTISNGGLKGSLTGVSISAGDTSTQKIWHTALQALGDIAFTYSFPSIVIIEIHDTIKAPPQSASKVMQKAMLLSLATATIFYMLCNNSSTPCTIFGVVQLLFSPILDFDQISCLSIVAAVMSFTCSSIGLSSISNGGFMGSLTTAISIGISTQKIWHTLWIINLALSKYMRIGRSSHHSVSRPSTIGSSWARMPTMGAVKGSGKCIGRAREVVPAGCSYGIPSFARAADCSLPPHKCDWFCIMGSIVINTDGSCVISAAVMCMEARYRRLDGKYHGAYSFFLKVRAEAVKSLKDKCKDIGAWKPIEGAPTVQGVLEVIRSLKKGIPTVYDNISLRLKSYVTFEAGELSTLEVTSMLQKMGPVIGVLFAASEYFRSTVYRGDSRAARANHAVVCTGYRYVDGELFIIIMDNVAPEGPFRFVLLEAFEEFHVLTVDAS